ncbi:MAG: hypothetical protein PHR87_05620 [Sulfurospirillaceae bacterium]|nr:hypothetical protein [Sulfurospirillaceae bacterium]
MKIALVCQSLLLSRALKSFLGDNVVPYKKSDFVISDKKIELDKPIFFVSSIEGDLLIPFSKSSLMIELDKFWQRLNALPTSENYTLHPNILLEEKITELTENFRKDLIKTIRDYCGS